MGLSQRRQVSLTLPGRLPRARPAVHATARGRVAADRVWLSCSALDP